MQDTEIRNFADKYEETSRLVLNNPIVLSTFNFLRSPIGMQLSCSMVVMQFYLDRVTFACSRHLSAYTAPPVKSIATAINIPATAASDNSN